MTITTRAAPPAHRWAGPKGAAAGPRPGPTRRVRAGTRLASLAASGLAVAAVGMVTLLVARGTATPPPTLRVLANVALTGTSRQAPLFDAAQLSPGEPVRRCVTLRYVGPRAGTFVRFGISGARGTLLADMTLQVAEGSGGGLDGSCRTFSGSVLYSGPFTAMVSSGSGAPLRTRWDPAVAPQRTFEITVSVLDTPLAMGRTASADLQWVLPPMPAAVPGRPGSPMVAGRSTASGGLLSLSTLEALGRGLARNADFAVPLLALIVIFLITQDRLDRADPKLMLANLASDPQVEFLPPDSGTVGAEDGP